MRFEDDDPSSTGSVVEPRRPPPADIHRQINQTLLLPAAEDRPANVKVLLIDARLVVLVTMQDRRNANQGQLILVLDTQTLELRAWQ